MLSNQKELEEIIKKKQFNKEEIHKLIPQREPFLMIDRVLNMDVKNEEITCEKKISFDTDKYLQGHFPNNPVVPGVIMIEMMAQASSVLGKILNIDKNGTFLLVNIDNCKFSGMATIGDILTIKAQNYRKKGNLFISNCNVIKNETIIAKCQITAFLKEI